MNFKIILLYLFSLALRTYAANEKYTDSEARKILNSNGITVNHPEPTTSLEGIRVNTIQKLLTLKFVSNCPIVVTGGTESKDHTTSGTFTHKNGYKVDIRYLDCINNYIFKNFRYSGKRKFDQAELYVDLDKNKNKDTYAKEYNPKDKVFHWDIFYPLL